MVPVLEAVARLVRPAEPGKVALCLAGGGIEGFFYEMGAVRALDAAHGVHDASQRRPIVLRLAGLAALIMRHGLAYESEAAQDLAASVAGEAARS